MKKVVLAGGTGHLGRLLSSTFLRKGYEVIILTRDKKQSTDTIQYVVWDGENLGEWVEALEGADILINLSGKSIQCRFTETNKKLLTQSRVFPTQILGRAISQSQNPPRQWINFSGISIFSGLDNLQNEESVTFGTDFLAELAQKWEAAFFQSSTPLTQKVVLRVSPVLSENSGMFAELYPLVRWGLGGQVGEGKQVVSWIHEQDLVDLVWWITQQSKPSSVYHACSPYAVSNKDFMKAFRQSVGISFGLPLPFFAARIGAFFKGVDGDLLVQSTPATTIRTVQQGFTFSYPLIRDAIYHLIHLNKK